MFLKLLSGVSAFHYNKDYNFQSFLISAAIGVSAFHYNKDYNLLSMLSIATLRC